MSHGWKLTAEQKQEIVRLYKTGLTMKEVADRFGVSHITVSRYVKKDGYDRYHRGGAISRTLDINALPKAEKPKNDLIPNQQSVSVVLTNCSKTFTGLGTHMKYTIDPKSKTLAIAGTDFSVTLPFAMLNDFAMEITAIANNATNVTVGTEAW